MANPATRTAPGDTSVPAVPSAPIVVPYGRGLQVTVVSYTPPTDFFRYRFFKNGVLWRESPTVSQIDYDVVYGSTYQYTVAAIDTALPPNISAQSSIGSGVPIQWQTPDINDGAVTTPKLPAEAVTGVSYQILTSVAQTRNATQAAAPVTGLSVTRSILGSNAVLLEFSGRWTMQNGSALVVSAGVSANLIRDGVTTISGGVMSGVMSANPGPGNAIQFTVPISIVDFPGAGAHTYTVNWSIVSTNVATTVIGTCDSVLLEVVELKR